jgi:hypothetical protein
MRTGIMKNQRDAFPAWTAGGKSALRKIDEAGRHLTLALEEDQPISDRGYNPYETVVHVRDTRDWDVWRNKPKRS